MSRAFKELFRRSPIETAPAEPRPRQRPNQWFLPAEGISREVITAEVQLFLGPDALVRPGVGTGDFAGQPGYWITAFRFFTRAMVAELKDKTRMWEEDRLQRGYSGKYRSYASWRDASFGGKPQYIPGSNYTTRPELEANGDAPTDSLFTERPQLSTSRSEPRQQLDLPDSTSLRPAAKVTDKTTTSTKAGTKRKFANTVSEDCTKDSAARHRAKFLALGSDDGPKLRFLSRLSRRDH